ncbi:fluoride efflux transporter CrcB [Virgibacillus ainsalahensis]
MFNTNGKGIWMKVIYVMIGGFLGAISRFALGEWVHTTGSFPLGTFVINLLGCLFLGWFLTVVGQSKKVGTEFTLMIGTGFIGSFTTFSTFSLETILLFQKGSIIMAVVYVFGSIILGVTLAFIGHKLAVPNAKAGD